ncbi:unnamed protein product, partial [Polarella glacialis]
KSRRTPEPERLRNSVDRHFPVVSVLGEPTCAICLSAVLSTERARELPCCSNCFHDECIMDWWLQKPLRSWIRQCPMCRHCYDLKA